MHIEQDPFQRFADGGAGGAGTAGDAGTAPPAPAADAGQEADSAAETATTDTAGTDGTATDDADTGGDPADRFAELIRGPYKAQFDAAVQSIVRGRLALHREQAAHRQQAQARAAFADILRQGDALRRQYPDFSLKAELAAPNAARLLRAGVPLQAVYELNHRQELAAAAAADGARRVAESVAANGARPPEAGAAGTGAAAAVLDPARLTRAQREDIKRRVAGGERIVLADYVPGP